MGLQKRDRMTYLKITDGKIRAKVDKGHPQAEERYVEINDKFVYELVYTECEGMLREIKQQTHEEYGISYNLILVDSKTGEKFSLQVSESSRYFSSFVQFLPSIDFSKPITVKPYSFKKDGRLNIGMVVLQDGEKVENHYKEFNEKTSKTKYKNGLEDFDFSEVKDDNDEKKILRIKLLKFLKSELKEQNQRLMAFVEKHPLKIKEVVKSEKPAQGGGDEDAEAEDHSKKASKEESKKSSKKEDKKRQKGKKGSDKEDDLPY